MVGKPPEMRSSLRERGGSTGLPLKQVKWLKTMRMVRVSGRGWEEACGPPVGNYVLKVPLGGADGLSHWEPMCVKREKRLQ